MRPRAIFPATETGSWGTRGWLWREHQESKNHDLDILSATSLSNPGEVHSSFVAKDAVQDDRL
jgi:hypothetical protein